jgi:GNAT superfamily N-acetyltransferase
MFPDRPEVKGTWQLRGMAVVPEVQRSGVGALLLQAVEEGIRNGRGAVLWCNARAPAAGFYEKHGWKVIGEEFEIPTAGPHVRMWKAVG